MYKRAPLEDRMRRKEGRTVWSFWGYDHRGKRYEASTHQTDWKAALESARTIERERASGDGPKAGAKAGCTVGEALDLIDAHDARVNAKPNTRKFHLGRAAHLSRLLGESTLLTDVTSLDTYTDKRLAERAPDADELSHRHTIQKEHRVYRLALRLAKKAGRFTGNPTDYQVEGFVKERAYYQPGRMWLEDVGHIEALITHTSSNTANHRIDRRDDMLVYVNLGLRRRELLTLTPERVSLRSRTLKVRTLGAVTLKTDKAERELPLNDVMTALFKRRLKGALPGQPLFVEWGSGNRDLRANWGRARKWLLAQAVSKAERAGLEVTLPKSLTFNDLRRTFCSQMRNAGVSLDDCVELLGHSDRTMVEQVYGHTSMDTLRKAVAKLPAMTLPESRPAKRPPTISPTNTLRESTEAGTTCGSDALPESSIPV